MLSQGKVKTFNDAIAFRVKSRCGRRKNTWRMTYLGPDRGGELRTEGTPNLKTQEARKTWIQDSAVLEHTESHLAIK